MDGEPEWGGGDVIFKVPAGDDIGTAEICSDARFDSDYPNQTVSITLNQYDYFVDKVADIACLTTGNSAFALNYG